jgi:hypothetical protein
VFISYLWARVEDEPPTTIPDQLNEDEELARAFGFAPDELPSKSTFRPVRLKNRFSELESVIDTIIEGLKEIAANRGSPIGFSFEQDSSDESPSITKRTKNRLIRKKSRDVIKELQRTVFPSISIPRPEDPIYDDDELLSLEAFGAIKGFAANQAGENLGDKANPDPETAFDPGNDEEDADPFYEDGPSGETVLEAIKDMSIDEISAVLNFALKKTYTRAKPRLQELEKEGGSRFGTRAKVAIDITYVAYYGEHDGMEWMQGVPDYRDKGYEWCHKFATAVIVGENTHYTVAVCPLGSVEYADTNAHSGKDRSYYKGDVFRRLLSTANEYVNIEMVYADREFHSTDVIFTLDQLNIDYIIPAKKDKHRVGPLCDRFDEIKKGYDHPYDTPLYVETDFPMHGTVKHRTSNTKVRTNLVILPPDDDDETHGRDSPQPFVTSRDVSDETALDRRWAKKQMNTYNNRAAVENAYSSIKECAAWTSSKAFKVRWFHFAFGCLVYNMWLLVDFLTQDRIGVIETQIEPELKLGRFLDLLDQELVKLL